MTVELPAYGAAATDAGATAASARLSARVSDLLRLYQRASDAATAGIAVADCRRPDMPLIYTNPAFHRMTGYPPHEVLGRNCRFLQGGERDQPDLDILRQAIRDGGDCSVLLRNYRKDGSLFWNELIIAPMHDAQGTLTHLIGIQTDVTERVHAQQALEQAHADLEDRVQRRTAELRIANETLLAAQYDTLDRLARAAEWRDGDTANHTRRVGRSSALLAEALGWDAVHVREIERAAILHDIGKVSIPDDILLKSGKLTPDEYRRMQVHALSGAAILAGSEHALLQMAETIARTHHERWDGLGYPHGLAGTSIPAAGRIVAIADVFDALTHARPYKSAWSRDAAIAEIAAQAGHQFDPQLVTVFVELCNSGAFPVDT